MSTGYREDITLEGLNHREFIATSIKTAESLGWEVHSVSDRDILLSTPVRENKSCESIFIRFNGVNAEIASKHDGAGFGNAAQNKTNVDSFIDTLNSSIGSMSQQEITERVRQHKSASNVTRKKSPKPFSLADVPGRGIRFIHLIVDGFIIVVILLFAGAFIDIATNSETGTKGIASHLLFLLVNFCYYFLLESSSGKTIGKYFTKTRVISEDGTELTTRQIVLRTFSRLIPLEAFTFLGDNGLHDKLSKTLVIKDK